MADVYATRADFFEHGLPDGLLPNPGRLLGGVHVDTDTLELDGHNFTDGTQVSFRAEGGGSLPAPLVAGTTYYVIPVSDALFQVSTTVGGAGVALTTAGSRVVVVRSMTDRIDAALEAASRHFDRYAPAHTVPLEGPYPIGVTVLVAQLAAANVLLMNGKQSEAIERRADLARAELARLAKGFGLRDARVASTSLAVARSGAASERGWDSSTGWPWSGSNGSGGGHLP